MTEPKYEEHTVPGINRVYKRRIPDCHPDKRHAANGLCVNCYQKLKKYSSTDNPTYVAWYTKNQDRILAQGRDYRRANQAKVIARRLGVSELEVREVLKESTCAICGDDGNLVVDHDHTTNKVRGRLCQKCNKGLGFFEDDPTKLYRAIEYLHEELKSAPAAVTPEMWQDVVREAVEGMLYG